MILGECECAAPHLSSLPWILHQLLECGTQRLADISPPRQHANTARLLEPGDHFREVLVERPNDDRSTVVGGFKGVVPSAADETASDDCHVCPPVNRRENAYLRKMIDQTGQDDEHFDIH